MLLKMSKTIDNIIQCLKDNYNICGFIIKRTKYLTSLKSMGFVTRVLKLTSLLVG